MDNLEPKYRYIWISFMMLHILVITHLSMYSSVFLGFRTTSKLLGFKPSSGSGASTDPGMRFLKQSSHILSGLGLMRSTIWSTGQFREVNLHFQSNPCGARFNDLYRQGWRKGLHRVTLNPENDCKVLSRRSRAVVSNCTGTCIQIKLPGHDLQNLNGGFWKSST